MSDQLKPAPACNKTAGVTLLGYYGFQNSGDEALLAGLLQGMRQLVPSAAPLVLSANPPATAVLHGVTVVDRWRPLSIWRALSASRVLFCGGGSLLQDVTSRRSLYYYLGILWLAQARGLRTCLFGQGIGPLRAPAARRHTKRVLQRCTGIWVRDQRSYDEVLELGVKPATATQRGPVLHLTADPAFLLAPVSAGAKRPVWVVAARPWHGQTLWQPNLVAAVTAAARLAGADICYLAMQPEQDGSLAAQLAAETQAAGVPATAYVAADYRAAQAALAAAELVIAMRLHALVLAAGCGVPATAISYDPKVSALAQSLELPSLDITALTAADGEMCLAQLIGSGWNAAATAGVELAAKAARKRVAVLHDLAAALATAGLQVEADNDSGAC